MKNLALSFTFFFIFLTAYVNAELQEPYVDSAHGYEISMPKGWEAIPLPPSDEYRYLDEDYDYTEFLEEYSVDTMCKFTGPKKKAYHATPLFILYKVKVKSVQDGVAFVKKYAKLRELGKPSLDASFTCNSKDIEMHSLQYMQSLDGWDMMHKCYIAKQKNGIFLLRFEYDCMCDTGKCKLRDELDETAKSFGFKEATSKKREEGRSRLLPGWDEIEGEQYVIQFKSGDKKRIKKYLNVLDKLDKCHRKLLPENKENEKTRPLKDGKTCKLLVKYFKDEESYAAYASERGGVDMVAHYSPAYDEIVFYDTGDDEKTLANLVHEATHMFLHHFVGDPRVELGVWINEGLAEYFYSAAMKKPGTLAPGYLMQDFYRKVQEEKRDNLLPTVGAFITWDRDAYYEQYIAYPYGCVLVHYLLHSKNKSYNAVVITYLHELQRLTFPLLKKLYDGGEDIWYIEEGEEHSEAIKICDELDTLHVKAQEKAFEKVDMEKLQKDFLDYLK